MYQPDLIDAIRSDECTANHANCLILLHSM